MGTVTENTKDVLLKASEDVMKDIIPDIMKKCEGKLSPEEQHKVKMILQGFVKKMKKNLLETIEGPTEGYT